MAIFIELFSFGSVFNPEIFCRWVPPISLLTSARAHLSEVGWHVDATCRPNHRHRASLKTRLFRPGRSDAATSPPRSASPRHPIAVVLTGKFTAPPLWSLRTGHRHCSPLGFPRAQVFAERHRSRSSTPSSLHLQAVESTMPVSHCRRHHVLRLPLPHSLRSHVGRCHLRFGLPHPRLRRLDDVGDNLPLVLHHRLTIHVLESHCHAEGRHRPRSSVGATRAGVA
jgi:hypothetical protein